MSELKLKSERYEIRTRIKLLLNSLCFLLDFHERGVEHLTGRVLVPLRDVLRVEVDDSGDKAVLHYSGTYLFPICGILFEQQANRF